MEKSDKEWACSSLTHCVREDTEVTLSAMKEKGSFAAVIECLCDSESLVVTAALGLVHACTVSGSSATQTQVSNLLVSAGVMTPLLRICATAGLQPGDSPSDRPVKLQILSRLLSVLCNLSSLSEVALSTICAPNVAPDILGFCLAPLQHRDLSTPEIMIYAVQLLSILTDFDDDSASQTIRLSTSNFCHLFNDEAIMLLKVTMANGNNAILLRSLVINVLINLTLNGGHEAEILAMLKTVSPVITIALDSFDASSQLLQLDQLRAATTHANRESLKLLDDSSQLWKDAIDAQGLLLEMLANLLVLGDESQEQPDDFQEMEESEANGMGELGAYMGRPLFPAVSRFIVDSDIASRLIPKCIFVQRQGVSASSSEEHSSTPEDDPEYLSLQQRALGCLLNAISNPEFEHTTITGADSLWREIVDHICAPAMTRTAGDLELIHDILQCSLAVLAQLLRIVSPQHHPGEQQTLLHTVNADDFRGFISIANAQQLHDQPRITSMVILGLLTGGPWPQTTLHDTSVIGEVLALLIGAMQGTSLILAAEAANALMDGFAEPTFDQLGKSTLVPAVNKFISVLKTKIALERKNMSRVELDRLDETRVNLGRFLQYKRSQ